MITRRIETHCLKPNDSLYQWAKNECVIQARVFNRANYFKRQIFTGHLENVPIEYQEKIRKEKYISQNDMIRVMNKTHDKIYYSAIKSHCSQQTVIAVEHAWRAWIAALKAYKKDPSKFLGRPRMPGYYKEGQLAPVYFTWNDVSMSSKGDIYFRRAINGRKEIKLPFHTNLTNLQQVRLVPKQGRIDVEIVYNIDVQPQFELDKTKAIGIDLGINNLMAITSNVEPISYLVNGRPIKSINQYFNKKLAQLKSKLSEEGKYTSKATERLFFKREMKIKDYFHKVSRRIADLMLTNNIGTCYIGHNTRWKQECNLGKRNNQTFISIPYNILINMLRYKIEEIGGEVIELNESHTSKCSFLDNETIGHHDNYIGKRIKRGLFQSQNKLINADINGSLNIIKRGSRMSFIPCQSVFTPTKIDIEKKLAIPSNRIVSRSISGHAKVVSKEKT